MSENPDPALEKLLLTLNAGRTIDDLDDETLAEITDRLHQARSSRRFRKGSAPRVPQRALALDALDVLGVPATPKVIAAVVEARTGGHFDARALTTARRDDRVAWDREVAAGKTPAPKLTPALHHELLEPVRAVVTVSSWELARRCVTPHSPRADHPAVVLALLDEADRLAEVDSDAAGRVASLASRLGVGIPGVMPFQTDSEALRRAAAQECARFAALADDERAAAAQRASMIDDATARVWGRTRAPSGRRRQSGG